MRSSPSIWEVVKELCKQDVPDDWQVVISWAGAAGDGAVNDVTLDRENHRIVVLAVGRRLAGRHGAAESMRVRERLLQQYGPSEFSARFGRDYDPEPLVTVAEGNSASHYEMTNLTTVARTEDIALPDPCTTIFYGAGDYPCKCGAFIWRKL